MYWTGSQTRLRMTSRVSTVEAALAHNMFLNCKKSKRLSYYVFNIRLVTYHTKNSDPSIKLFVYPVPSDSTVRKDT